MREKTWERLAASGGIGFFLLGIVSMALGVGNRPKIGVAPETVVAFWEDQGSKVRLVYAILGFALLLFLWFVSSLRAGIARVEGPPGRLAATCFAGGIATFIGLLVADAFSVAPGMVNLDRLPPEAVLAFNGLAGTASDTIFALTSFAKVALIGATGLAAIRFQALPRWFGWVSLAVALVTLVGAGAITEGISEGQGGVLGGVLLSSFIAFVFWVLAASILLTLRAANFETREVMRS